MLTMLHPIAELQITLGASDFFRNKPILEIDDVTTSVMKTLHKHNLTSLTNMDGNLEAIDTGLNYALLNNKICHLTRKPRSREMNILRQRQHLTLCDILRSHDDSATIFLRICNPCITRHFIALQQRPDIVIGNIEGRLNETIYDRDKKTSVKLNSLTSKQVRHILQLSPILNNAKRLTVTTDQARIVYKKIKGIVSIPNKTKILCLIHGDVYCGSRLKKFNISTNDRCIRCFEEETIQHLLIDCNYTKAVWNLLGWNPLTLYDILEELNNAQLEIAADIIKDIVFGKKVIPPTVLVKNIYSAYASGKCKKKSVTTLAQNTLERYMNTGSWYL